MQDAELVIKVDVIQIKSLDKIVSIFMFKTNEVKNYLVDDFVKLFDGIDFLFPYFSTLSSRVFAVILWEKAAKSALTLSNTFVRCTLLPA